MSGLRHLTIVAAAALAGCGSSSEPADAPQARAETDVAAVAPAELGEARPYDSAELGALHGVVLVEGDVPERFVIGASKHPDCQAHADVEFLSDVVVANDGKLANVFVHLAGGEDRDLAPPPPSEPVTIDQRGCIYTPHAVLLRTGQTLRVATSDPATHNVNVKAPRNNSSKNLSMVAGQAPIELVFRRPESVFLKCDIHPWMSAWAYVEDHPWCALSDEAGAFTIEDVPPGEYVVEAVHEAFGSTSGRVRVEAGRSTGVVFRLTAE